MKRTVDLFLCGAMAFFVLSCGSPKTSNLPSQSKQTTAQNATGVPSWLFIIISLVEGGSIVWLYVKSNENKKSFNIQMNKIRKDIGELREGDKLREDKTKLASKQPSEQPDGLQKTKNPVVNNKKDDTDKPPVDNKAIQPTQQDLEFLLLEHYENGILRVVSAKEQAYYQVAFSAGQNNGQFEFIGDARKAIKNRSAILDDVCEEKEKFDGDATSIHTDAWGTCIRQSNDTWKVTKKAKISFK
ncbi:MAG: hypothetical protein IJ684_00850 [Bacteroidales bacterium]|nr:hypothetical protein [Bacteroidales bacterium]